MLSEKLKSWEYYKNKLPLYMQNSYGILEHFDILYNILINLDKNEDEFLSLFDIMSSTYLNDVVYKYDTSEEQKSFRFLDILGKFFGITREFNINLNDEDKHLSLTNSELLKLLKVQVIKNNFDGSYEQLHEFYDSIGLPIYFYLSNTSANVNVIVDSKYFNGEYLEIQTLTQNEIDMINAGLFNVESLGIKYTNLILELDYIGVWDNSPFSWDNEQTIWG